MHTISITALVFLPISTVAVRSSAMPSPLLRTRRIFLTARLLLLAYLSLPFLTPFASVPNVMQSIFGSQFFNFNIDTSSAGTTSQTFSVSSSFWIFWVISVPLTLLVLAIWMFFRPSLLPRNRQLREPNRRGYDRTREVIGLRRLGAGAG